MKLNYEHSRPFFRALMPPGTCLEMRVMGAQFDRGYISPGDRFSSVFSGNYDNLESLLVDAGRLRGISGYVIPNPTIPDMLACSYNKLSKTKTTIKDEHIACLRWLYLDYDAKKPSDNMSATDTELTDALAKRDSALAAHEEMRDSALYGCSGNGGFIIVRLPDYPNDAEHRAIVASAVDYFADNHGADRKTKNPARLMPLVGTWKCKGSNRPERPWRLATLDSPHDKIPAPFDLVSWVAEHCPAKAPQTPSDEAAAMLGMEAVEPLVHRIATYLGALSPAIAGHGGHDQTFDAACALTEGFGLTANEARPYMDAWNARCQPPWTSNELDHKLADAEQKADGSPRKGYLLNATRPDAPGRNVYTFGLPPNQPPANGNGANGLPAPDPDGEGPACTPGFEDNPHRLARLYIRRCHDHAEGVGLKFWKDQFHIWSNSHYQPATKHEIRADVTRVISEEFYRLWQAEVIRAGMNEGDGPAQPVKPLKVSTTVINDVLQALSGMTLLSTRNYLEQPAWIDNEMVWHPSEVLPMRNAVVHLPSFADGLESVRKPTPKFFCPYSLKYDWNPDVKAPERLTRYLEQIWPDDEQSRLTIQEWFGLNLVADTSYQKIMALIGPPGSGKGTLARLLQAMVGIHNCVSIRFSVLEEPQTLESAIGKLCMIIPDGRLSPKSDQAAILESILSISGEDPLTVNRKYIAAWTGKLLTRITLVSNDVPRFHDPSAALSRRLLVLRFTEVFDAKSDRTLEADLKAELPSILLWAIEGWKRLRKREEFIQPESGKDYLDCVKAIASPIGEFAAECLHVGKEHSSKCSEVYLAWKQWCERNNKKESGTQAMFGRDLRSICPSLKTSQVREHGVKPRYYLGIGLVSPEDLAAREEDEPDSPEDEAEWFR